MIFRNAVQSHEADIVAVACVFWAGVAEADEEFHGAFSVYLVAVVDLSFTRAGAEKRGGFRRVFSGSESAAFIFRKGGNSPL